MRIINALFAIVCLLGLTACGDTPRLVVTPPFHHIKVNDFTWMLYSEDGGILGLDGDSRSVGGEELELALTYGVDKLGKRSGTQQRGWRLTAEQAASPPGPEAPKPWHLPLLRAATNDADRTGTWAVEVEGGPLQVRLEDGKVATAAWLPPAAAAPLRDRISGMFAQRPTSWTNYKQAECGVADAITSRLSPAWVAPGLGVLYAVDLTFFDEFQRLLLVGAGADRRIGALAVRRGLTPPLDARWLPISEALVLSAAGDARCSREALVALAAFGDGGRFGGDDAPLGAAEAAEEASFAALLAAPPAATMTAFTAWAAARAALPTQVSPALPGMAERSIALRAHALARCAETCAAGRLGSAAMYGLLADAAAVLGQPWIPWPARDSWRARVDTQILAALPACEGLNGTRPLVYPWTQVTRQAADGLFAEGVTTEHLYNFAVISIADATARASERWRLTVEGPAVADGALQHELDNSGGTTGPRQKRRFSESNAQAVATWRANEGQRTSERAAKLARLAALREQARAIPYDHPGGSRQVLAGYETRRHMRTVGPYESGSDKRYKAQGSVEETTYQSPVYRTETLYVQNPNHPVLLEMAALQKLLAEHDPIPAVQNWFFEPVQVKWFRTAQTARVPVAIDAGGEIVRLDLPVTFMADGELLYTESGRCVRPSDAGHENERKRRVDEAMRDPAGAGATDLYATVVLEVWRRRWAVSLGSAEAAEHEAAWLAEFHLRSEPAGGPGRRQIAAALKTLGASRTIKP